MEKKYTRDETSLESHRRIQHAGLLSVYGALILQRGSRPDVVTRIALERDRERGDEERTREADNLGKRRNGNEQVLPFESVESLTCEIHRRA